MIRQILSLMVLACSVIGLNAARPTVYFQQFDNSAKVKDAWVETVRGAVLEGLHNTNRVNIIDAVTEASRYEEELRRLKENLATDDLETTEALQTRGANVLISGDVTAIPVTGTPIDGGTSYKATATFILRIVNALDGTLIGSKTFTLPKTFSVGTLTGLVTVNKSQDEAVQAIKGEITKAMKGFVAEAFPVAGTIEEVESLSKNNKEIETFYISIGSEDGLVKGEKLDVKTERKIGQKVAAKVIGEVEIMEIVGDDISLCKVRKGGADIKAAYDGGHTIKVSTKTKK
ncbi:MAG: hypothetical protein K2J58_01165 [Muribaculaceae bacterium]|nr:hypothetical protein [Muribaculaceae bacterium]